MNYNIMKKADLVKYIVQNLVDQDENNLSQFDKKGLIQLIKKAESKDQIITAKVEGEGSVTGVVVQTEESTPVADSKEEETKVEATPLDVGWTDYALNLLTDEEKIDGYPTCDGLRRLFGLLGGIIVRTDMQVVQAPDTNNGGRATVKCTIEYRWQQPLVQSISDVADCYYGNTVAPYCKHPTATAATMAEGRALRKAMKLRTLLKEEMQTPKGEDAKTIDQQENDSSLSSDNQKNTIKRIADRLEIDVPKLLEFHKVEAKSLDTLTQQEAQFLLRALNKYQQPILKSGDGGGEAIPESILKIKSVDNTVTKDDKNSPN